MTKQFTTLAEAEEFYNIEYINCETNFSDHVCQSTPVKQMADNISECLSPIFRSSPEKATSHSLGATIQNLVFAFKSTMSNHLQKQLLKYLYKAYVINNYGSAFYLFIQPEFLESSLSAMKTLYDEKKHNLLYHMSVCFQRISDKEETRMPLNRMPFGLIDYNIRFFSASSSQKLNMENHYALWLETMLAHFGQKWLCLFRGPFWQYDVEEVSGTTFESRQDMPISNCQCAKEGLQSIISSALEESNVDLSGYSVPTDECDVDGVLNDGIISELSVNIEQSLPLTDPLALNVPTDSCNEFNESSTVGNTTKQHSTCNKDPPLQNINRSYLWAQISEEDREAIENDHISPECMEEHHTIRPVSKAKRSVNPNMYDTTKVCTYAI